MARNPFCHPVSVHFIPLLLAYSLGAKDTANSQILAFESGGLACFRPADLQKFVAHWFGSAAHT